MIMVMTNGLEAMMASPERRHGDHVDYSVRMVSAIADQYNEAVDTDNFLAASCMVDAFYVHVRLLADFLVRPTKRDDFGPKHFGVAWVIPSTAEAKRLKKYWKVASTYVVHFGRPRVPRKAEDLRPFAVGQDSFREILKDTLLVFSLFMKELIAVTPDWQGGALIPNAEREPQQWRDRLLFDRTEQLNKTFREACRTVDLDPAQLLEE